ncbi:MAG: hypothetical protein LBT61_00415 [Prevotellaceae bacterium]|nr:hypothetical protein [Prevotellaceae bacterium]
MTFSATVPNGVTIDWYTADTGGALVSGGGSVTSFSPSINASATYYAEARYAVTGCASTSRLAVGATVGNPSVAGQAADPMCGCESALSNCSGTCSNCCSWAEHCGSFTERYPAANLGDLDVYSAQYRCSLQGDGWRLPTKAELECMYQNQKCLDGLYVAGDYWSATYFNNDAYYTCMLDNNNCGTQVSGRSNHTTCVR